MPDQNKTRHVAGKNAKQRSSIILAALVGFPVKVLVLSVGGTAGVAAHEAVRWLVGGEQ